MLEDRHCSHGHSLQWHFTMYKWYIILSTSMTSIYDFVITSWHKNGALVFFTALPMAQATRTDCSISKSFSESPMAQHSAMLRPSDFCSTWSPAALLVPGAMMSILGSHLGASWGSSVHQKWVFMDLGMDGIYRQKFHADGCDFDGFGWFLGGWSRSIADANLNNIK